MDNKNTCLVGEPQAVSIFKTLYLFLQHHNFPKSAETLRKEWGLSIEETNKVSNISVLLTRCKCSKNQANQTEPRKLAKYPDDCLEGSFQGETFQVKRRDTRIFYVCDHYNDKNAKVDRNQRINENGDGKTTCDEQSPQHEARKLKSKFSQLQDEHQKLIAVTSELTSALQMNIVGQTQNIYSVMEHCKHIYPSLFESTSSEIHDNLKSCNRNIYPNIEMKQEHFNDDTKIKIEKTAHIIGPPHPKQVGPATPKLSPRTPIRTPLTPETVRCVLEVVFERIFEIERRTSPDICKSPLLNKEEIEKIVWDVLNSAIKSPLTSGLGEGEGSRPDSGGISSHQNGFFYIDFPKLKADLMHSDNERKIRILQALRWRITKSDTPTREKVLEMYIANDILELRSNLSIPEKLLLDYGSDHYVQESTCRLINTLASLRQGRDYLTTDERLLKRVLIKKVRDVRAVSGAVIRNMLVASVQKLSIRKQCRTRMVNEGLFEIIVEYLDEFYEKLSKYCLEYCSALLMNLCLVKEAKFRSTKNPRKIVGLLRKFLDGENEICLPYINGVMFSLFEKSEIVAEALHQHLDKAILNLIKISRNENVKKQLEFILHSRLFGKSETNIPDDDEDTKGEVDLLEVELDQDDFITQLPSGEKLLREYKTDRVGSHYENSRNSVSFVTMPRDPPNSAKTFCEEIKQFAHKPSSERGIFETAKPRRFSTCSQNLIKNYMKNKMFNQGPATPLCYMENCQKLLNGKNAECSCSKCVPGRSKYSCGCYEDIKKEIAADSGDVDNSSNRRSTWSKSSQLKSTEVIISSNASVEQPAIDAAAKVEGSIKSDNNDGGRSRSGCKVCGEKKCDCAFESRPKLCRTPTL